MVQAWLKVTCSLVSASARRSSVIGERSAKASKEATPSFEQWRSLPHSEGIAVAVLYHPTFRIPPLLTLLCPRFSDLLSLGLAISWLKQSETFLLPCMSSRSSSRYDRGDKLKPGGRDYARRDDVQYSSDSDLEKGRRWSEDSSVVSPDDTDTVSSTERGSYIF